MILLVYMMCTIILGHVSFSVAHIKAQLQNIAVNVYIISYMFTCSYITTMTALATRRATVTYKRGGL